MEVISILVLLALIAALGLAPVPERTQVVKNQPTYFLAATQRFAQNGWINPNCS